MKNRVSLSIVILLLSLGATAEANAWTRHGTATGPHGTSSVSAWGNCAGGTCQRSITRTGPYGRTMSRSGYVTCDGTGYCSGARTTTGPKGATVVRRGSVQRW